MSRLFICSESDKSSIKIKEQLLLLREWKELEIKDNKLVYQYNDNILMCIPDLHIYADNLDKEAEKIGIKVDDVVFLSKHSSASGDATLTVHPIGNYHDNKFGGKEKKLVKSSPALMSDALRRIISYNDMTDFKICFEVTHHGPWLEKPTFFIEIGSDERNWENERAAKILAEAILDNASNDYINAVGIAGGHYAPRFSEMVTDFKINFGHMIPNYQLENSDDEDLLRMIDNACKYTDTNIVYMHRKALKKPVEKHMLEIVSSAGYEIVSSSDLDRIDLQIK